MKTKLFNLASVTCYALIWASDHLFALLVWALAWTGQIMRFLIAQLGIFVMRNVSPDDYEALQGKLELENQQTELELLAQAAKLRDHALELGDWTTEHTEAIESIAAALLNECDWDEDHIHQYLKEIVESVPGLQYGEDEDPFDGLLD